MKVACGLLVSVVEGGGAGPLMCPGMGMRMLVK